jgi:glycosyltransferase involved in cell wall biosynthesis
MDRSGEAMMLINKSILIVSPEPWDHLFVSKHHYAIHLAARGNQVFFLNPPTRSLSIKQTEHENLQVLNYFGFVKGMRFFPMWLRKAFFRKSWEQLQALAKTKFDVIWSFDNSVFYDFDAFPEGVLKISHIVDLNQDFETERAASSADICFCTTEQIKNRLIQFNKKTFKITHGYNAPKGTVELKSLPGRNRVKALYAGNLAMQYLDWEIIAKAVEENPQVDFVFVGSGAEVFDLKTNSMHDFKQAIFRCKNVYKLGKVSSEALSSLYQAADVLLIAYQQAHHADQANPHKMMEYLGSGKVIVCTHTAEYLNQKELLAMCGDNHKWPALFKDVVANLEKWNAEESQNQRKEFAMDNTYERQLERIEGFIQSII